MGPKLSGFVSIILPDDSELDGAVDGVLELSSLFSPPLFPFEAVLLWESAEVLSALPLFWDFEPLFEAVLPSVLPLFLLLFSALLSSATEPLSCETAADGAEDEDGAVFDELLSAFFLQPPRAARAMIHNKIAVILFILAPLCRGNIIAVSAPLLKEES